MDLVKMVYILKDRICKEVFVLIFDLEKRILEVIGMDIEWGLVWIFIKYYLCINILVIEI